MNTRKQIMKDQQATQEYLKPQHTPTPWRQGVGKHTFGIWGPEGDNVANCNGSCVDNAANAAFIVRAVNAHEEMLEALKEAQKIISTARRYFPKSIQSADKFSLENTCAVIGQAIAKAEGGK